MGKCINISHPDFKELVDETGIDPMVLASEASIWQDENNTDEFPDADVITDYINSKDKVRKATYETELTDEDIFDLLKEKGLINTKKYKGQYTTPRGRHEFEDYNARKTPEQKFAESEIRDINNKLRRKYSMTADLIEMSPLGLTTAVSINQHIKDWVNKLRKKTIHFQLDRPIKEGVPELFESNPELANAVYEALGFKNQLSLEDIGVSTIDIEKADKDIVVKNITLKAFDWKTIVQDRYKGDSWKSNSERIKRLENSFKEKGILESKPETRIKGKIDKNGNINIYDGNHRLVALGNIYPNKKITIPLKITKGLFGGNISSINNITPQQKQQAQQLYSQYLDTIFPDSKVKDIVYHGTPTKFKDEVFDASTQGKEMGQHKQGFFFTNSKENAFEYADFNNERTREDHDPFIYSAVLNAKNPLIQGKVKRFDLSPKELAIENIKRKIRQVNTNNSESFSFTATNGEQYKVLINISTVDELKTTMRISTGLFKPEISINDKTIPKDVKLKAVANFNEFNTKIDKLKNDLRNVEKVSAVPILDRSKYDSVIQENATTDTPMAGMVDKDILLIGREDEGVSNIIVFEPEQIHILGSKQDIKGFKGFVKGNKLSNISSLGRLQGDKMESERGQIGVNKQQLLTLLGPTMYNKPLAQVAVKELLQNSFDAVKARMNITGNKTTGNIDIIVNYDNRTIAMKDDGIGMTSDIVKNAFLSIGGTNKEGLDVSERSGGFGLAKVQFLLGSEYVKVITVRDGVKTSLEATAVELYNDNFMINKEQTNEPNGSYVEVKIPESYTTMEGVTREIDFPGRHKLDSIKYKSFEILGHPLIGDVNVSFTHIKVKTEHRTVLPIGKNTTEETLPPLFSKIDFSWGTADLYMSTEKKEYPDHKILSSGIYQFTYNFNFRDYENIPYDIVVNIKPSVSSVSEQYPFNNQREGFKNTVREDIESLELYLAKYASGEAEKEAKAAFSTITGLPKVDPNKVLTPEEREKIYGDVQKHIAENKQRRIDQGLESAEEEVRRIRKLLINKEGVKDSETGKVEVSNEKRYGSSFKAEKEIEKIDPVEATNFNPAQPQYHNNTNFNYLDIPGAAEFFSDFGSVVLEMVRFAGNELGYNYQKLKSEDEKFFAGVSIDKQYGGVHVKKIINAIFVNPLSFNARSLEEAVGIALHVTIHEINHTTTTGHRESFTTALAGLYGEIYATGKYGLYEGLFRSVFRKHFETFKQLKNEYNKSSTRNLSESFSGDEIKGSITRNVQGNVNDVSTRQPSTERYPRGQKDNTKDKTGDIILSKFGRADEKLNKAMTDFLSSIGVNVITTTSKSGPIAIADIINRTVTVSKGRAGMDSLPEEAAHFYLQILRGKNKDADRLVELARESSLHKDTVERYSDEYEGDEEKLAMETAGRLLASAITERWTDIQGQNKQAWYEKVMQTIRRIIVAIKNLFRNAKAKEMDRLTKAMADSIIANTTGLEAKDLDTAIIDLIRSGTTERNFFQKEMDYEDLANKMIGRMGGRPLTTTPITKVGIEKQKTSTAANAPVESSVSEIIKNKDYYIFSDVEKIKEKQIAALEKKIDIYSKRPDWAKIVKPMRELLDKMRVLEGEQAIMRFLMKAISDIDTIYTQYLQVVSGVRKMNAGLYLKWTDWLAGYDSLNDIISALVTEAKLANTEPFRAVIGDRLAKKKAIEDLFLTKGKEVATEFLAAWSVRTDIEWRKKFNDDFNKENMVRDFKSPNEFRAKRQEYVDEMMKNTAGERYMESKEMIARELSVASKDMNWALRWVDTILDIDDAAITPMIKAYESKELEILNIQHKFKNDLMDQLEKLEAEHGVQAATKMYSFMIEKEMDEDGNMVKNGKPTQHYVARYHSKFYELKREKFDLAEELNLENPDSQEAKDALRNAREWRRQNTNKVTGPDGRAEWIPVDKWLNPQYKELEKLKDVKDSRWDFYEFFVDTYTQFKEATGTEWMHTRLPAVEKKSFERKKEGEGIVKRTKKGTTKLVTLREDDIVRGSAVVDEKGKPVEHLPIYYTNKIEEANQSYDMATTLELFARMAISYSKKSEIINEMRLVKLLVENRKFKVRKGNTVLKKVIPKRLRGKEQEEELTDDSAKSNIAARLSDWFTMEVYGKEQVDEGTLHLFNNAEIDVRKGVNAINKFTALNLLGLNMISGIGNIALGETMQIIEGFGKEFYTINDYRKGKGEYWRNIPGIVADIGRRRKQNKISVLLEVWNVLNDPNKPAHLKDSWYKQLMSMDTAFFIMHSGEHFMQTSVMLAMLNKIKPLDKNGNVIQIDGKDAKMLDMFEVNNGRINLSSEVVNFGAKEQSDFVIQLKRILANLHGEYSDNGRMALQKYSIGRSAAMFRKFIVPGWKRRWGNTKINELKGGYTSGNYRDFGRFTVRLMKDLFALRMNLMSENWNKLSDRERANILKALGEIQFLLMSIVMSQAFLNMGENDDEDDRLLAFMQYQAHRLTSELLFFVSPNEAQRILRSPAAIATVSDKLFKFIGMTLLPPWKGYDRYDTGPRKGQLRLVKPLEDLTPFYKQYKRLQHIDDQLNFYNDIAFGYRKKDK